MGKAFAAARWASGGSERRAWRFVERLALWTEEALSEPRMWAIVRAMAQRLQVVEVLESDEAWELMEVAAGEPSQSPYFFGTYKWRRRFGVVRPRMVAKAKGELPRTGATA